jgi:hypothetical protein
MLLIHGEVDHIKTVLSLKFIDPLKRHFQRVVLTEY